MKTWKYSYYYIGVYIIIYTIGIFQVIGGSNAIYLLFPAIDLLVLNYAVFFFLNKNKTKKASMAKPFIIVTSLFNIGYYFLLRFSVVEIIYITVIHNILFLVLNSKYERDEKRTVENIENYYQQKK